MFPTEAYLLAILVGIIAGTVIWCLWDSYDCLDKLVMPMVGVLAVLATFIIVSEVWWMVLIYRSGAVS
jgi:hypothetical protein